MASWSCSLSSSSDFFTWETHYSNLPSPFHKEAPEIRADIRRIRQTRHHVSIFLTFGDTSLIVHLTSKTDYQFNRDLIDVVNQLNDGHFCTLFCHQVASFMTFYLRQKLPPSLRIRYNPIILLDMEIYSLRISLRFSNRFHCRRKDTRSHSHSSTVVVPLLLDPR